MPKSSKSQQPTTLQFDAIMNSVRTRRDNSLSLAIETPELTNEETLVMLRLKGINLKCSLTPEGQPSPEVLKVKAEINSKTPSQRMRAVIFLLWKQEHDEGVTDVPFETYYNGRIEKLIEWLKKKLPEM